LELKPETHSMPRIPSLRLHRPSGQAVVTLAGTDRYLGRYGSPEAKEAYDRLLGEWLAAGRPQTTGRVLTMAEVLADYIEFAKDYYAPPSRELDDIRPALRPLKAYANEPVASFGPLALRAIMDQWVRDGLARSTINARKGKIIRFVRWAVSREKIPSWLLEGLKAVEPLRAGRTAARESEPRTAVAESVVKATLPHLTPHVAAIVELLWLTGARPSEILTMRTGDIDRTSDPGCWRYRPRKHKNSHRKQMRVICLGPKAQTVLGPWLKADPDAYIFQPREAVAALAESRKKSHRTDEQRAKAASAKKRAAAAQRKAKTGRAKASSSRNAGEVYDHRRISNAVRRACLKHGIEPWTPYQMRHSMATRVEQTIDFDTARKVLGKKSLADTARYVHADERAAAEVMKRIG
jgi:integrase